jgi:hypothetical protein
VRGQPHYISTLEQTQLAEKSVAVRGKGDAPALARVCRPRDVTNRTAQRLTVDSIQHRR